MCARGASRVEHLQPLVLGCVGERGYVAIQPHQTVLAVASDERKAKICGKSTAAVD